MVNRKIKATLFAILAAVFYALNVPFSKQLLKEVPPTLMASFLYFGAGVGVGFLYFFLWKRENKDERLTKEDLPYTLGMVALDIIAPIFLMLGISIGSSANASLLGNFEIAATALIALIIFKEKISKRLCISILFIIVSGIILSFEGSGSFQLSMGSLFVLLATMCWGLENNCTVKISDKSTCQIVTIKGLCCGAGSFIIANIVGESLPEIKYIALAMLLGFVAYGLSIFLYIRAQRDLGAAKTSAYYSVAPFIGTFLAFVINGEKLTTAYFIGLIFMMAGTVFAVADTLICNHKHVHTQSITHTHDGTTHTHIITHEHSHNHISRTDVHNHHHKSLKEMSLTELWELFPIHLTEHKEWWADWYEEERDIIKDLLSDIHGLNIYHIGSTAIRGIWAKPIVDILVEIPDADMMKTAKERMIADGYICMSDDDKRVSLNKGYTEEGYAERVFHIHLRLTDDKDEIYFRDYLNEHAEIAKEYENLKLDLWKKYEHDRDGYTAGKTEFVVKYSSMGKRN